MNNKLTCLAALCALFLAGSVDAQELGAGKVLFEYWTTIGGTSVDSNLRTLANFPDNPSSSEWRDSFKSKAGLERQRRHTGPRISVPAGERRLHLLGLGR